MLYCAAGPAAHFIYVVIFLGVEARGDRATVTSVAGRKLGCPGNHTTTRELLTSRGGVDSKTGSGNAPLRVAVRIRHCPCWLSSDPAGLKPSARVSLAPHLCQAQFGIPETRDQRDEGPLPSEGAAAPQHCADPPMGWMQPREIGWRAFFSGLEAVRRWRVHSGSRLGNPEKMEKEVLDGRSR